MGVRKDGTWRKRKLKLDENTKADFEFRVRKNEDEKKTEVKLRVRVSSSVRAGTVLPCYSRNPTLVRGSFFYCSGVARVSEYLPMA